MGFVSIARDADTSTWTAHVLRELASCRSRLEARGTSVEEVATAVACFCVDRRGLARDSRCIDALIGRALWSVGHPDEARRFLVERVPGARSVMPALLELMELGHVPPLLWMAVVTGVCRRSEWLSRGSLWILDLKQLDATSELMELRALALARTLLGALATVWQPTGGEGCLGLAYGAGGGQASMPVAEWVCFCDQVLAHEQASRGWGGRPEIIVL